ncbi:Hypothetical predicted protein, partial [Pelobates cultripes]
MLKELQTSLQADFTKHAKDVRMDIQAMGERTSHLEQKAEQLIEAHNSLVYAYSCMPNFIA